MTSLGQCPDYYREHFTLPDLASLTRYWKKYPPVHVSVALYLGFGKGESRKVTPEDEARSMEALAGVLGPPSEKFTPRARRIDTPPPADTPADSETPT